MRTGQTQASITLGVILALIQVVGIPFSWKEILSGLIAVYMIGWGLYIRYANQERENTQ